MSSSWHAGVPAHQAYNMTLYILAALLLAGFVCNLLVRPVADRHFMTDAELAAERAKAHEVRSRESPAAAGAGAAGLAARHAGACSRGSPSASRCAWGVWTTLTKALPLFRSAAARHATSEPLDLLLAPDQPVVRGLQQQHRR